MTKTKTLFVAVTSAILAACSGGNFDVAPGDDDSATLDTGAEIETLPNIDAPEVGDTGTDTGASEAGDTGTIDSAPEAGDTGSDTGASEAGDTGTDTGASEVGDTGVADSAPEAGDTGTDTGMVDSGVVADSGDSGDSGPPCTEWTRRCVGMQLEQCVSTSDGGTSDSGTSSTAWVTIGGLCNYACLDATSTKRATCACDAPLGRFSTVADTKSPDGYAIKDTKTGLTWADSDIKASLSGISLACASYGKGGWRVPTKAEWEAILGQVTGPVPYTTNYAQVSCYGPDAPPVFKFPVTTTSPLTQYWSSDSTPTGTPLVIDIYYGEWVTAPASSNQLRCVHD
jgi:hypothetical protein